MGKSNFERAVRLFDDGRFEAAASAFREALDKRGRDLDPHFGLALALSRLARRDEAIAELRAILAYEPNQAVVHDALGRELAAAGDFAGAERAMRSAIALVPEDPDLLHGLGLVLAVSPSPTLVHAEADSLG
jgi:Flp pilus assembly protein TadD